MPGAQRTSEEQSPNCSHLVHRFTRYRFPLPTQFLIFLYDGVDNFGCFHAASSDLWIGAGMWIAIDASSTPSTALSGRGCALNITDGPYWRAQGRPRFYRSFSRLRRPHWQPMSLPPANNGSPQTKALRAPGAERIADGRHLRTKTCRQT